MIVDEGVFVSTIGLGAVMGEWKVDGLTVVSCVAGGVSFSLVVLISFLFLRNWPVLVFTI